MAASPRQASLVPARRLVARGAADNPANRFERLSYEADAEMDAEPAYGEPAPEDPPLPTQYFHLSLIHI